jgi:DNA-binding NtrC family response regulator/tetratricopeptide (TPR) repeat protein
MIETNVAVADHAFLSQIGRLHVKAALATGRHAEAVSAARRARRRRHAPDAGLALEEAEALLNLLRYREAAGVATRGLRLNRCGDDSAARLRLVRAHALWMMGRAALARAELRRATALAVAPLTRARVLEMSGLLAWKDERKHEARAQVRQAFELYAEAGSVDGLARALEQEAGMLRAAGRLDDALKVETRRVEVAAASTRVDVLAHARTDRGDLLAFLGRWDEARQDLDAAVELFRGLGDPREHLMAATKRAMLDLARGDLASVRRTLACVSDRPLDESASRLRAEHELLFADLHLAAGEDAASEAAAARAVAAFTLMRCREGECRARIRRAHALIVPGRLAEAVIEARRAASLASRERNDLRLLALLARGRALLRAGRSGAARAAFEAALRPRDNRPGPAAAARLGLAVARGAGREHPDVREALGALEAWGDRRFLAYALADVRALLGAGPQIFAAATAVVPGRLACSTTQALADAATALLGSAPWAKRFAGAMAAVRPMLPWWRVAWVAPTAWELRTDLEHPIPLAGDDVARAAAAGATAAAFVDLRDDAFAAHAARVLHGVTRAIVAPTPSGTLYLDFREDASLTPEPALGLAEALATLVAVREPEGLVEEPKQARFPEIVGRCEAMKALFADMERVAPSSMFVHVVGETGTGKERVAHAIHAHSARRSGPFVAVNASSLSDELFEAEMFGHTRGAFTGAVAERRGHVAEAEGGTLFLDEVADLTPKAQAKLLRFLADGEYRRLGESEVRRASVRIVTAANVALAERVREGLFREDLMYRLTEFTLRLPPLRERGEDILVLARHFLMQAAREKGAAAASLPGEVAKALRGCPWPGNVRQLRSEINRLVVLASGGPLRVEHLSIASPPEGTARPALRDARAAFERETIARLLPEHAGNRVRTAAALGISRQALVVKIRQYGL